MKIFSAQQHKKLFHATVRREISFLLMCPKTLSLTDSETTDYREINQLPKTE